MCSSINDHTTWLLFYSTFAKAGTKKKLFITLQIHLPEDMVIGCLQPPSWLMVKGTGKAIEFLVTI